MKMGIVGVGNKIYHLANAAFIRSLKNKPIIINAARGEMIDTETLLMAMD